MAKIYNDFQPANLMSFAKSFARLNGQPLDKSEIWYDIEEAKAYAATEAAYVGQILSVIDTDNNQVAFYGIQDAAGTLIEVGAASLGDELSIEIVDNKVQLKNFNKKYYAYIPAVKDEEGNIITPSKYELTEGFKAGLEPKVVLDGEDLILAWYEPGNETVEDIAANVESVSKTVDTLDEILNAEGGLVDQVDELKDQVGTAADDAGNAATGLYAEIERLDNQKANIADVYTKEETNNAIATAVAGADHLRREVVSYLPSADEADPNIIYMIPSGLQEDDNKYYEWILIDGIFEQVGSWEVDLSNYATKNDISNINTNITNLSNTVDSNKTELDGKILNLQTDLENETKRAQAAESVNATEIAKKADKGTTLAEYGIIDTYTKDEITTLISDITGGESAADVKAELTAYKTTTDATLQTIQSNLENLQGAEANYISSVDETTFLVQDGKLSLTSIKASQVEGLQEIIQQNSLTEEQTTALQNVIDGKYVNYIKSVTNDFEVTEEGQLKLVNVNSDALKVIIGDITTLIDYAEGDTIVSELNELKQLLIWQEMNE